MSGGRPRTAIATHGEIHTIARGARFVAETRYRDLDGPLRKVNAARSWTSSRDEALPLGVAAQDRHRGAARLVRQTRGVPRRPAAVTVRRADLRGVDAGAVSGLLDAYLRQTEHEKALHLEGRSLGEHAELPSVYRLEVDAPQVAYADAATYLAEVDSTAAGVVVLRQAADGTEVKRLWADPAFRGRGVGSALIRTALRADAGTVRLSVWQWRSDALRLYASRGFRRVPSWDPRPALVCMEHPGGTNS